MPTQPMRVLLIEDNPGDARLIQEMLRVAERRQYYVFTHTTLEEGVASLTSQPVDLVLLDLSLPDSLGIETVSRMRAEAPLLPIVVLTGHDDENTGIQTLKAGAQDYLVKGSVDTSLLERALSYAIQRSRIEAALRHSEESYRSLIEDAFNNSSSAVFVVDNTFKIVWINQAAENYFNIQRENILGRDIRDVTRTHIQTICEAPENFINHLLSFYENISSNDRIGCHVLPGDNYEERWLEHSSRPIHSGMYAGGRIIQYTDVTELKRAEQAEHVQRVLAEALRDTAAVLTSTLDVDEVLDRVLENVGRVLQHDAASVMLLDDDRVYTVRWKGYIRSLDTDEPPAYSQALQESDYLLKILETGTTLTRPNIADDPLWKRSPEQDWWQSYIGTPIYLRDQIIGFINLYSLFPDFYNEVDAERLEAFAKQTAIAIQNARLHQQSRELATVQERQRLARELHDSVTQALFTTTVMADSSLRQWNVNPEKAHGLLKQVFEVTTAALAEMRVLLLELRPQALVQVGFEQLISQLITSLRGRKQIELELDIDTPPSLPPDVKIGLYRVFQEILNNMVKHSGATRAVVRIKNRSDALFISVEDNGQGFDLAQLAPDSLGLGMMRERTEMIGAALDIQSTAGQGTQVSVTWPHHINKG